MPTLEIPFCGPAYKLESQFIASEECINFYPRSHTDAASGKKRYTLLGTEGLTEWLDIGVDAEVRGVFTDTKRLYAVIGSGFYVINKNKSWTLVGSISSSSGPVKMETNGLDVTLVDGPHGNGYVYDLTAKTLTKIVDLNFYGGMSIIHLDGYYVINRPYHGTLHRSGINDGTTWGALAYTTAGEQPDNVICLVEDHGDVWAIGEYGSEIYVNSGDPTFTFTRIQSAYVEEGGSAFAAVCKINNAIFWLAQSKNEVGQLFQAVGRSPRDVSDPGVALAMEGYTLSDAVMFAYKRRTHPFVVVTFPTSNATWVYDSREGVWHQRSSIISGALGRWRANCYVLFDGTHIVGDYTNGKLYTLDPDAYDEDGTDLVAIRTAPLLQDRQQRLTVNSVQVVTEPGVGLITGDAKDIDPQGIFSWSRDGANTWSDEEDIPLGKIGEYDNRASVEQLGQGVNWVFRLKISAAVKRAVYGAVAEVEQDD